MFLNLAVMLSHHDRIVRIVSAVPAIRDPARALAAPASPVCGTTNRPFHAIVSVASSPTFFRMASVPA